MPEPDFHNEHYEQIYSSEMKISAQEETRIKNTIDFIPNEINTLLEVGCGDGRIINRLIGKYKKICGLDISSNALKYVKTPKIQGSLEKLPFPDNSFDIVICCEVLEHLPYPIYNKALKEIERVSKNYILISVPNDEKLDYGMIKCPKCGCSSHIWRHLRSFNNESLKSVFENFKIEKTKIHNLSEQFLFPSLVIKIKSILNNQNQDFPANHICPQCEYTPKYSADDVNLNNIEHSWIKLLKKIMPTKKTGGWIIVLYKIIEN